LPPPFSLKTLFSPMPLICRFSISLLFHAPLFHTPLFSLAAAFFFFIDAATPRHIFSPLIIFAAAIYAIAIIYCHCYAIIAAIIFIAIAPLPVITPCLRH